MRWPMKVVWGVCTTERGVREFEVPGYAWILNVYNWVESLKNNSEIPSDLAVFFEKSLAAIKVETSDPLYPLMAWFLYRRDSMVLNAASSWHTWISYLDAMSIPGEAETDGPNIFVDNSKKMFYLVPSPEILDMRLDSGVPDDWGWRAVSANMLNQIIQNPDHHESILEGTEDRVSLASIKRIQRPKERKKTSDKNVFGKLDFIIKNIREG